MMSKIDLTETFSLLFLEISSAPLMEWFPVAFFNVLFFDYWLVLTRLGPISHVKDKRVS